MISFWPPAGARSFGSSILPDSRALSIASRRDFASFTAATSWADGGGDDDEDEDDEDEDDDAEESFPITRDKFVRYARSVHL